MSVRIRWTEFRHRTFSRRRKRKYPGTSPERVNGSFVMRPSNNGSRLSALQLCGATEIVSALPLSTATSQARLTRQKTDVGKLFWRKIPSHSWCHTYILASTVGEMLTLTLSSFLVDFLHETTKRSDTAIAYIYCNYKEKSTHSTYQLLSSIARQITEQVGELPPVVKQFRDQNATKKRNPTGEEWIALIQSLRGLFSRTIIVVDALVCLIPPDPCSSNNF